jgi:hypothetical protein
MNHAIAGVRNNRVMDLVPKICEFGVVNPMAFYLNYILGETCRENTFVYLYVAQQYETTAFVHIPS